MADESPRPAGVEETDEEAGLAESPSPEPPTLEMALTWLAKIRAATVLALLREPEFALVTVTAFAGFRVNATGYGNPIVRKRLAQEAMRDHIFAERLRFLAEDAVADTPTEPSPSPTPAAPPAPAPEQQTQARHDTLRAERDRRRRERDEARQALAESQAARTDAETARRQAEAERQDAERLAQRQAQRIERLERQVTRLRAEQGELLRALKQQAGNPPRPRSSGTPPETGGEAAQGTDGSAGFSKAAPSKNATPQKKVEPVATYTVSPPASGGVARNEPGWVPSPWQTAVAHLLDKRRYDQALALAEDVLRTDPDETSALDIAARAHEGRDEPGLAAPLVRHLLALQVSSGHTGEAADTLLRLLRLLPFREAERDIRAFLAALRSHDALAIEQTRGMLVRLRGLSPGAYQALTAHIQAHAPSDLAEALIPTPGLPGLDDPLPFPLPFPPSARRLLQAVDSNELGLVSQAREALTRLCQTDPEVQARARAALERAAEGDDSVLRPLLGPPRGPVVVDGSNAAWSDQDTLAAARPRLQPLLELRRTLRRRGYFPVLLFGDAPLPYTIDEPERLREMIARREIVIVDSGVDADEVLVREARRQGAPLVTNDYMTDWDPLGDVTKIRYGITASGAYLQSDSDSNA